MSNPMRLTAITATNALGGFVMDVMGFANFSRAFPVRNRLSLIYSDKPFKRVIVDLCPQIDRAYPIGRQAIPLQALSRKGWDALKRRGVELPAEVAAALEDDLHATMMTLSANIRRGAYSMVQPWARFRVPPDRVPELSAQLIAAGADPSRFLVAIHCREGASRNDPANDRNGDPGAYYLAARHVIEAQGGQVVRLGQANGKGWDRQPGLVDLTKVNSLMLQAFALSRARYAICGHSGLMHLAMALQTPLAAVDAMNWTAMAGYDDALCLTKVFVAEDGAELRGASAMAAGLLLPDKDEAPSGYRVRGCTSSELMQIADRLHAMTADCAAWREPEAQSPWEPDERLFRHLTVASRKRRLRSNFFEPSA